MNEILKEKNDENIELTNKLLVELLKNQKQNHKDFVKVFIVTIICFSAIIISGIIGFLVYESQFETITSDYQYEYDQELDADNGSNAILSNGDLTYVSPSETNDTN